MSVVLVIFYYFCSLDYDSGFIKRIKRLMAKKKLDKEAERTPSSPGAKLLQYSRMKPFIL